MQAVQFAKIDNADAKVTGYESANCGDCEGVKDVKEESQTLLGLWLFSAQLVQNRTGNE